MAKGNRPSPTEMEHPPHVDHEGRRRRVKDYDPAEFFVPATNAQDHSDQYRFRAPRGYNRRISEIVTSGKFPFRTSTDFLRWCLHHGCKRADMLEPSSTVQQQLEMMRLLLGEAKFQQDFIDMFAEAEPVIQRYIDQDDKGAARNLVARLLMHIRKMPDETNWRGKYEQELRRRYGWLIDEAKGRKLAHLREKEEDNGDD